MKVIRSPSANVHPSKESANGSIYFLSNLDQNQAFTVKILQCFASTNRRSTEDVGDVLRASLQKVLDYYFPLDGHIAAGGDGKIVILMDGSGVPFVEAVADVDLEQIDATSVLHAELAQDFCYCPPARSVLELPPLTVQLTKMKCGGFLLGLAFSHFVVDGISIGQFLRSWAEAARGVPLSFPPFLDRTLLRARCPPLVEVPHPEYIDLAVTASVPEAFTSGEPILQRYFTFDASKLARLKRLAYAGDGPPPTTFASLTGLVWLSRTKALNTPSTDPVKLLFAVNVRNRLKPPLPVGFFGNGIVHCSDITMAGELVNRPLSYAVEIVQHATRRVTDQSVPSVIDYYEFTRTCVLTAGTLMVSDLTRVGFGDVDFGWRYPKMAALAELMTSNMAIFLPASNNTEDILVVITLPESTMSAFKEIIQF